MIDAVDIAAVRADIESTEDRTSQNERGASRMYMTWDELLASIPEKRAILKKYGLDAPSRRKVSFNTSERFMREAFGGGRIPQWAKRQEKAESEVR